ncbi:hypothetical protein B0T24DRAFT_272861 [Lasiosphaeria ovina]|uniref:Uncharacterized protein n=1 Tax=Lasiosphaeria ovina TaxID=92902 RepID=A0AAE0N896_9PEZI|nr:hypothetical protein B0T24DRAFT_272861 [Lasiosphaeria ovina]
MRFHEFDRVARLRGRPRGSTVFAPDPRAPRSMAPLSTEPVTTAPTQTPTATSTRRASGLNPSIRRQPSRWEGINLQQEDSRDQQNTMENPPTQAQRTVNGLTVPPARGGCGGKAQGTRATKGGAGSRRGRVAKATSTPRISSGASRSETSSGTHASTPTARRARGGITKAPTRGGITRRTTRALAAAFEAQ